MAPPILKMHNSKTTENFTHLTDQLRCGLATNATDELLKYFDTLNALVNKLPPEAIVLANGCIESLLFQYEHHDWLGVADTIQYDLNNILNAALGTKHD
jgi:hypothetical protein